VTEDGHAGRVRLKDSSPSDGEMESCMTDVLKDMPVPPSAVQALTPQTEAEAVSPESRGFIGNPLLAVMVLVELVPVVVVAAGVTVVVGVTVYTTAETAKRQRKMEKICSPPFYECLNNRKQPKWTWEKFGETKDCLACLFSCRRHGEWPDDKCPRSN
jgi:hypothetical protein